LISLFKILDYDSGDIGIGTDSKFSLARLELKAQLEEFKKTLGALQQHLESINAELPDALLQVCKCLKNKELKEGACTSCESRAISLDQVYEVCDKYSKTIKYPENDTQIDQNVK